MLLGGYKIKNIPPRWAFLLPLLSAGFWWAMLIAMLVCWIIQGRPLYQSSHYYMVHTIVYLSYVGATNLQPLFIVGTALMGIFFTWSQMEEFYLRSNKRQYLLKSFSRGTHALHWLIIIETALASLFILMVACLKDDVFDTAHMTFVGLFIVADLILAISHISLYFVYYRHYHKKWFLTSAMLKGTWLLLAIGLAIGYLVLMKVAENQGDGSDYWGYSGVLEWCLCFWFGILFFFFALDLSLNKNLKDDVVTGDDDYYYNNQNHNFEPSDTTEESKHQQTSGSEASGQPGLNAHF